tara:strand:+ start:1072 stop:1218 length:147 start_codon:yes stop_codon:yes gene_type:complete
MPRKVSKAPSSSLSIEEGTCGELEEQQLIYDYEKGNFVTSYFVFYECI